MNYRNARLGFFLFFVYLALYGGFVLLNAFAPQLMQWTPLAGINLAILYGFGYFCKPDLEEQEDIK